MNKMTSENLRSAFGGESQAHMRYRIWADVAEKEGFINVSRLFKATSQAEEVHARLHFKELKDEIGDFAVTSGAGFGILDTAANLIAARDGEVFEYTQMYPAYIAVAEMQEEKSAAKVMKMAVAAEKIHAERYQKAYDAVNEGKDLDAENILLCPVCGYISIDINEEKCPICGAPSSKFIAF